MSIFSFRFVSIAGTACWLKGPEFLHLPKAEWPKEPTSVMSNEDDEVKKDYVAIHTTTETSSLPDIGRFSSWLPLIRTTAQVIKFTQLCRKNYQNISRLISLEDMQNAEKLINFVSCRVIETNRSFRVMTRNEFSCRFTSLTRNEPRVQRVKY